MKNQPVKNQVSSSPFSPLQIHVSFTNRAAWMDVFPPSSAWLREVAHVVFGKISLSFDALELSFLFTHDAKMQELNRLYLGQDKPTNVLSFPSYERVTFDNHLIKDPLVVLGDVVFSLETIQKEASILGKTIEAHLTHLLVHGLLHLRGYDHEAEQEAIEMETLEIEILTHLGFSNPYPSPRGFVRSPVRPL